MDNRSKWKLILVILALNFILTPLIMTGVIATSEELTFAEAIGKFKSSYSYLFEPKFEALLSQGELGRTIIAKYMIDDPVLEEVGYRGLGWVAVIIFPFSQNPLIQIILWTIFLVPNYIWASAHPLFLPVFIAGVFWSWLTIKTKSLWPAIACHVISNISIYLAIQVFQLLFYPL